MDHDFKILIDTSTERGRDFRRGRAEKSIQDRITRTPVSVKSSDGSIEQLGTSVSFPRKAEIFYENQPAEYLYKVISGTVRTYKSLSDGRRKIGAFYMPGDFFGLETGCHAFSAEAITDAEVLAIKRDGLVALAAKDNKVASRLWSLASRELERVHRQILLLVMSAEERVAGFLCEMADRFSTEDGIELPMSRQDIADYLGLTIETVSRTLTHLERAAVIALPTSRRVVLHSRSALTQSIRETGSVRTQPIA
jgi:CRP/FNR family transcriptional regulator, nitrogen fixation regulation protein